MRTSPFKIVVVDDDPVHNLLLRSILERAEYDVRSCESGAAALAEVAHGCDCLITDYHMPGMNGAQLIRAVRRDGSPACIVLTGSDGFGVEEDSMAAGAALVLRKPMPPQLILWLMSAILAQRRDSVTAPSKIGPQPAHRRPCAGNQPAVGLR